MDQLVATIISGGALIIAATILEEMINFLIGRAAKLSGASPTVARDIKVSLRIILVLVVISVVLSVTHLASEFTALTISGIGALALSLALQTTLSNIISGILLMVDGVIRLNDEVEYSGVRGKVVRVALRNTWIKKEDGSIAVVSNAQLSGGPLVNHTAGARLKKKYAIE